MFEKDARFERDARVYVSGLFPYINDFETEHLIRAYQDGAEFGYSKGYHDAEEHYLNVIDSQHKLVEESKANEWHDINTAEPSKEQLGKQLLIRMESVTGDTDYDYLVYKYTGESIKDVPGVLAWKEIE